MFFTLTSSGRQASADGTKTASRRQLRVWLVFCLVAGMVVVFYLALSLAVSADPLLMPLDDTYIHFQYARQVALGEPLVYNPGDPATSGGTSFVYPLLLAVGYVIGFSGWSLAYWAAGIGAVCFLGSMWLVYLITRDNPLFAIPFPRDGYAMSMALAFALSGPVIWAALSGMETALFVFVVLLTLYALQEKRVRLTVIAALMMTLLRPEGLMLAGISVVGLGLMQPWPSSLRERLRRALWLALPVLAGLVQPLVNVLATGSTASTGMQAKSHLYNTGAPFIDRVRDIIEFFFRMWRELLTGQNPHVGMYTSPMLAGAALTGLLIGVWIAWRDRRPNRAVIVLAWIAGLTAGISTLDTAFWQFKRYQLPVMVLFFPVAGWLAAALGNAIEKNGWPRALRWVLPVMILVPSGITTVTFARNYMENVAVVRDQQVPMAQWVKDHVPEDARIGAHDVGLVRYFGERPLYDVVGLTTPGAASAWRQGPGAVYETMSASKYRPDYFAIYPDVQGLTYLLDAGVFGDVLAEFPVDLPPHNVAAATGYQAVYRADWSATHAVEQVAQTTTLAYTDGLTLVDQVDVADHGSEAAHDYHWWSDESPPGFVTEVYRHYYHACGLAEPDCQMVDGGRVITGGETFTLKTRAGEDLLLVTRVHGRTNVPFTVFVNGQQAAQRVQPEVPGRWIEVATLVPAAQITGTETRIRIEAQVTNPAQDAYMPYSHWAYQGVFDVSSSGETPVATFGPDGAVRLMSVDLSQQPGQLDVSLTWAGPAPGTGDGVVFVHLYDNIDIEPVAQVVTRPAGGVLPPGNWLLVTFEDNYTLVLPDDLAAGTYQVALGIFDAQTGARYDVTGERAGPDRRLFIGEITVEAEPGE
ncbi:MAG: hypothetical protein JW966_10110 [Anaerolineae bacterium]|nr:hypothetical protein [Anaerolineae bacterium]